MACLLINDKTFEEVSYSNEEELERAAATNKNHIFGINNVFIDYKRKVGSKNSRNIGIPDGFLIDFSNSQKPQLFFVEYELESHQLYEHIGPQIMRFYASFETGKRELQKKLSDLCKKDTSIKKELEAMLQNSQFDNLDSLLNYLIFDHQLGIVLVIDEQSEDLNSLLTRFANPPEVVELKKFQHKGEIIYHYTPFREGLVIIKKDDKGLFSLKEINTIVCPAVEEGFKHAFHDNDSWWAIRISPTVIPQLKYIAMYETAPVSQVRWIADIKKDGIKPYKNTGKYIIHVENKRKIGPISLDKEKRGMQPQSPRYTTFERINQAKKLSELWYK
jgi:hypothetical protein